MIGFARAHLQSFYSISDQNAQTQSPVFGIASILFYVCAVILLKEQRRSE
jgi:hypothetical protein